MITLRRSESYRHWIPHGGILGIFIRHLLRLWVGGMKRKVKPGMASVILFYFGWDPIQDDTLFFPAAEFFERFTPFVMPFALFPSLPIICITGAGAAAIVASPSFDLRIMRSICSAWCSSGKSRGSF